MKEKEFKGKYDKRTNYKLLKDELKSVKIEMIKMNENICILNSTINSLRENETKRIVEAYEFPEVKE